MLEGHMQIELPCRVAYAIVHVEVVLADHLELFVRLALEAQQLHDGEALVVEEQVPAVLIMTLHGDSKIGSTRSHVKPEAVRGLANAILLIDEP